MFEPDTRLLWTDQTLNDNDPKKTACLLLCDVKRETNACNLLENEADYRYYTEI